MLLGFVWILRIYVFIGLNPKHKKKNLKWHLFTLNLLGLLNKNYEIEYLITYIVSRDVRLIISNSFSSSTDILLKNMVMFIYNSMYTYHCNIIWNFILYIVYNNKRTYKQFNTLAVWGKSSYKLWMLQWNPACIEGWWIISIVYCMQY